MALGDAWASYPNQFAAEIGAAIRKTAVEEAASRIGEVIAQPGFDTYDIRLSDGGILSSVTNGTRSTWPIGSWVTIERAGEIWQIAGLAPSRAG